MQTHDPETPGEAHSGQPSARGSPSAHGHPTPPPPPLDDAAIAEISRRSDALWRSSQPPPPLPPLPPPLLAGPPAAVPDSESAAATQAGPPPADSTLKPWHIALGITALALAALAAVVAVAVSLIGPVPDNEVMSHDFAAGDDIPRGERGGLAWEVTDGNLTLTTSSPELQRLAFEMSPGADVRAVATLSQPALNPAPDHVTWGLALINAANDGIAVLCSPNGPPRLVDLTSGRVLGVVDDGACGPTMELEIWVQSGVASFMAIDVPTDRIDSLVASDPVEYGEFTAVAPVLASNEGSQTLQVASIAAYQ